MKPLMMGGDPSRLLWILFPYQGHGSFVRGRMVKSIVANEKVGSIDLKIGDDCCNLNVFFEFCVFG